MPNLLIFDGFYYQIFELGHTDFNETLLGKDSLIVQFLGEINISPEVSQT